MKPKVHITGASGFLGTALSDRLKDQYDIIDTRYDLLTDEIRQQTAPVDYIFHCAVKSAAGGYCQNHPGDQFEVNQRINCNILEYWRHNQPQAKFVTFGTSCAYDNDVEKIESNYMKGVPETGYEVYGGIKRMLLLGLQSYAKEFNMKYSYFIPSTLYGEGYHIDDKHFIYDLIRKICSGKYNNEPVILWGTGHQTRDLIYINDAVDIILRFYNRDQNMVMNLCSGKALSIRDYAKIICDYINYDFDKISFDTTQFVGAQNKRLVSGASYDYTSADTGIGNTIEYYLANYNEHTI